MSDTLSVEDNASRLTDATSGRYSNLVHRAYDAGGRMTSEALTIGAQTFTTTSAYDAANRDPGEACL